MPRVTINNRAEPQWDTIIESRVSVMLGSVFTRIARLEIDFDYGVHGAADAYTCQLRVTESEGTRQLIRNDQPDGAMAIEGALGRARRSLIRAKRDRAPAHRQVSG
jgi:hypothetical protein